MAAPTPAAIRFCMSCGKNLATKEVLDARKRKKYLCESCYSHKTPSPYRVQPKTKGWDK